MRKSEISVLNASSRYSQSAALKNYCMVQILTREAVLSPDHALMKGAKQNLSKNASNGIRMTVTKQKEQQVN